MLVLLFQFLQLLLILLDVLQFPSVSPHQYSVVIVAELLFAAGNTSSREGGKVRDDTCSYALYGHPSKEHN